MSGGPASPVVDEQVNTTSDALDEDRIFVVLLSCVSNAGLGQTKAGVRIGVAGLSIVYITCSDFNSWTKQNKIRLMYHTPII
jgi:hypothetical protein